MRRPEGKSLVLLPRKPEPPPRTGVLPHLRRYVERSREIPEFQVMNDVESELVTRFGAAFRPENLQDPDASTTIPAAAS